MIKVKKKFISFFLLVSLSVFGVSAIAPSYASAAEANRESVGNIGKTNTSTLPVGNDPTMSTKGIPFGKQILVKALRVGGPALGTLIKKIPYKWAQKAGDACSKWSHKAADVIDQLTSFGEAKVTAALMAAGIPPGDAQLIAKVVVFFLV